MVALKKGLHDFEVLQRVDSMIKHLPNHLLLVIITRGKFELSTARLRAQNRFVDVDMKCLCFNRGETASFLEANLPGALSEEDVTELHDRLEGWPVGLSLTAPSMRKFSNHKVFLHKSTENASYLTDYPFAGHGIWQEHRRGIQSSAV